jgi:hypothetical protein
MRHDRCTPVKPRVRLVEQGKSRKFTRAKPERRLLANKQEKSQESRSCDALVFWQQD